MSTSFIAAEKCQQYAAELENNATEENEAKIVDNYLALVKEGKVLKSYIANVTNKKNNITDFEKYEKEIKKKYKSMTSSQFSNSESQRQMSFPKNLNPMPTKKSMYAEPQKSDAEYSGTPDSYIGAQKQEGIEMQASNPNPVCCHAGCNVF